MPRLIGLPPPPPALTQWDFTSPFEGVVEHLYLDSRGHPTCGAGFLVPTEPALQRYPWHPSHATALGDYRELAALARVPGFDPMRYSARYYRKLMCARITEPAIRAIFAERVAEFRWQIEAHWDLSKQPACIQIALVDMAYTLGARGLTAYARMLGAIRARHWSGAAAECHRAGVQRERNEATQKLIASAGGVA